MTPANLTKLQDALALLAEATHADLAAVVADLDGMDARQGLLAVTANKVHALAVAVTADAISLAEGHEQQGEFGDALHYRWQALAASEYAAHIEAANEASSEAEANGTFEDDEEPQTLAEYREEIRSNGLPR